MPLTPEQVRRLREALGRGRQPQPRPRAAPQPLPAAPEPPPDDGGVLGAAASGFRGLVPQGVRDVAGGAAQTFLSGERTVNLIGAGFGQDTLGTDIGEALDEVPRVGGALRFAFDTVAAPATLVPGALGARVGFRGAGLVARSAVQGGLPRRLAGETALGLGAGAAGKGAQVALDAAEESGAPVPGVLKVAVPLAAALAGGVTAARAVAPRAAVRGAVPEAASDAPEPLVAALPDFEQTRAALAHLPEDMGPAPIRQVVEFFANRVNPSALLRDPFGQNYSTYFRQRAVGESAARTTVSAVWDARTSRLRGTSVFDVDENGIARSLGRHVLDILDDPKPLGLDEVQSEVHRDMRESIRQMNGLLADEGLVPQTWATEEGLKFPRQALSAGQAEFSRPSNSFLVRVVDDVTEAVSNGDVVYADPRRSLEIYLRSGYEMLAEKQLADAMQAVRTIPKDIVRARKPEVIEELVTAARGQQAVQRELRAAHRRLTNARTRLSETRLVQAGRQAQRITNRQRVFNEAEQEVRGLEADLVAARRRLQPARAAYKVELERAKKAEWVPGPVFGRTEGERIPVTRWRNGFVETTESVRKLGGWIDGNTGRPTNALGVLEGSVEDITSAWRQAAATADFSMPFIQGLPLLARHPAAWGRMAGLHFKAWLQPRTQGEYLRVHLPSVQRMAAAGVPVGESEFFSLTARGVQTTARTPIGRGARHLLRSAPGFSRFQEAYETGLTVARVELWEALIPTWKGTDAELAQYIRNMTGGLDTRALALSPRQRALEGVMLAFSPRLLRSTIALTADAARPWTPQGQEAFVSLMRLAGAAAGIYYLVGSALDKPESEILEGLNPLNGRKFLGFNINGEWIGVGGQVRAITQFAAQAVSNPSGFLTADSYENPLVRFYMSRAAPGAQLGLGVVEFASRGHADVLPFETVDNGGDFVVHALTSALPFVVQSAIEQGITAGVAADLVGLRSTPQTLSDLRNAVAFEHHDGLWEELTPGEQQDLEQRFPRLKEMRHETGSRALRTFRERSATIDAERLEAERGAVASLAQGFSRDAVAEGVEEAQRVASAKRDAAWAALGLGDPQANSETRTAVSRWYEIVDEARVDGSGLIDWTLVDVMRAELYGSVSPAARESLDDLRVAEHAPEAAGYFAAKALIAESGYYEVAEEAFERLRGAVNAATPGVEINSYTEFIRALNLARLQGNPMAHRLDRLRKAMDRYADRRKFVLRRLNPALDAALLATGRASRPVRRNTRPSWP